MWYYLNANSAKREYIQPEHEKGYICYLQVPGRIGGACISLDLIEWFKKWIEESHCQSVLEIGTFDGILLSLLAEQFPTVEFTTMDCFESGGFTGAGHRDYAVINFKDYNNITLYIDKSENVLPRLAKEQQSYDLIFIDGDHSYKASKLDLVYSYNLLRPNGCVVLHDSHMPSVVQAYTEFSDEMKLPYTFECGMPMFRKVK